MTFYKHGTTEPMELDVFTVWYTDLDISKYGGGPTLGRRPSSCRRRLGAAR